MAITKASSNAVSPAAKGDLVVGSATNDAAVLTVGANGTVLTAASGQATGLEWATPASGGMTLLSTTTLSGASTVISGISGSYKKLYGVIFGVTNATATAFHNIRPNSVSASAYSTFTGANANATKVVQSSEFTWNFDASGYSLKRTSADNVSFFEIHNYASTTAFKAINSGGLYVANNDATVAYGGSGAYYETTAITSLQFLNNGGYSYSTGTVLLYGVN